MDRVLARKIADKVLAPENLVAMNIIKAQHLIAEAAARLCKEEETQALGLNLFVVAAWLSPEVQAKRKEEIV